MTIKAGLQEINDLIGVWGSIVINNQARVIEALTPPGINSAALSNITNHVVELLNSAGGHLPGLKEAVFHYSQRKLFIFDLEQAILVVICTPSADISLLRMTSNVVLTNWETDTKAQKQFKANFVDRL
jgi:predicted regulator of Ras-like GTPase activity (Roadblock/LC7/MglB family)